MAHLSEHVGGQIPHLIMPDTNESPLFTRHGVGEPHTQVLGRPFTGQPYTKQGRRQVLAC